MTSVTASICIDLVAQNSICRTQNGYASVIASIVFTGKIEDGNNCKKKKENKVTSKIVIQINFTIKTSLFPKLQILMIFVGMQRMKITLNKI